MAKAEKPVKQPEPVKEEAAKPRLNRFKPFIEVTGAESYIEQDGLKFHPISGELLEGK